MRRVHLLALSLGCLLLGACNDERPVVVQVDQPFQAAPFPEQESYFPFLRYTLTRVATYEAGSEHLRQIVTELPQELLDRQSKALVLQIVMENPNTSIPMGEGERDMPLIRLGHITALDGKPASRKPLIAVNGSAVIKPESAQTAYLVFAVPARTETVTVALGDPRASFTLAADLAVRAATLTPPSLKGHTAEGLDAAPKKPPLTDDRVPGCWSDTDGPWVRIGLHRPEKKGVGEALPDQTIGRGEKARIHYVWQGFGKVLVEPQAAQVPQHNYKGYAEVSPQRTTDYVLTPTIKPSCAVTVRVWVR